MRRNFAFNVPDENLILEIFVTYNNPVSETKYGKSIISVEVRNKEGFNIPHFHFIRKNNKEGCIRIDEAKYFNHGNQYKETLNKNECYILNEWMDKDCPLNTSKTNWEYIKDFWNASKPKEYQVTIEEKPDYSSL